MFPPRCQNVQRFYQALKYATFYASTVNLLPTHRPETNAIVAKNRRIGVSISGIAQWASGAVPEEWGLMNYTVLSAYLRNAHKIVRTENAQLAKESGIPASVRVCTVKPSGSISLLAGVTPGVHYPVSRYAIRRMRIGMDSPLVEALKQSGIPYEKDVYSDNTLVFEFTIDHGDVRPCKDVSPWEQFALVAMLQKHYADNCVSACLTKDHYIHTDRGFVRLDKLCLNKNEAGFHDHDLQVYNQNGVLEKSGQYYVNGARSTIKITLENGKTIQGTHDHKLLVLNEVNEQVWKQLSEITPNDWVIGRSGLDRWGTDQNVHAILDEYEKQTGFKSVYRDFDDIGFWLGYRYFMTYHNKDIDLEACQVASQENNRLFSIVGVDSDTVNRLVSVVQNLFGITPQITDKHLVVEDTDSACLDFCNYFSNTTEIPDIIMSAPRGMVIQFLRGLLGGNYKNVDIMGLENVNANFIKQLDVLLNNFGISGNITRCSNGMHIYTFLKGHVALFNSLLDTGIISDEGLVLGNQEFVPDIGYAKEFCDKAWVNYPELYKPCMEMLSVDGKISRKMLNSFVKLENVFIPSHLVDPTYSFTQVHNVKHVDTPTETFDISVADTHSYLANGVVSHNTIYFDKEKDGPDVEKMLAMFIPSLKSVSMLPHSGHGYAQAPYEPIDEETYKTRLSQYNLDFTKVTGNVPVGSKFCSGDTCEL